MNRLSVYKSSLFQDKFLGYDSVVLHRPPSHGNTQQVVMKSHERYVWTCHELCTIHPYWCLWKSHERYVWTCHEFCTIHPYWCRYERVTNSTNELVTNSAVYIHIDVCMKESRTLHMNLPPSLHYTSTLIYVWKSHELYMWTCHKVCTMYPY